ncbi:MAG: thermonuclease family protein [Gammaproteobacteria bacterium]|nr:thermonuclease family protein [Gammaproteobacteria bacterium]
MKRLTKIFSIIVSLLLVVVGLVGCTKSTLKPTTTTKKTTKPTESTTQRTKATPDNEVDYAASVAFDLTSTTKKAEVTVKTYVDGDTTHFNITDPEFADGILKARYIAVNTPESTGLIEEWGKAASNWTKEALKSAESIYVESDNETWNKDSTASRVVVWVWYRKSGETTYRNLNIELLQKGLAINSSSKNNRYGDTCMDAIQQAMDLKYCVYSDEKDPDFYYGDAIISSIKELRMEASNLKGKKVAVVGNIIYVYNNGVYIEDYDQEDDLYYGFYCYYGFNVQSELIDMLNIGNRVIIVGSCQYYEAGGSYQVSGLQYDAWGEEKDNCKLVEEGKGQAAYENMSPEKFVSTQTITYTAQTINTETQQIETEVKQATKKVWELSMNASLSMDHLVVKSAYQETNTNSSSFGAMTLTCEKDGQTITVRLTEWAKTMSKDDFVGKTISVRGIIDVFNSKPQIKVFSRNNVTIEN